MTALLGLLAVAGYQNRDKLAEMLGGLGQNAQNVILYVSSPTSSGDGQTVRIPVSEVVLIRPDSASKLVTRLCGCR